MTRLQKAVVIVSAVIIAGMGLFPPWRADPPERKPQGLTLLEDRYLWRDRYHFLFTPIRAKQELLPGKRVEIELSRFFSIDFGRLALQWVVVVVLGGELFVALTPSRKKRPGSEIQCGG